MNVYGYARVSTRDQNLDTQVSQIKRLCEFRGFNLINIYEETASGKNTDRSAFQQMLKDLSVNPHGVEAVIVYKLDRIGRSLSDLMKTIQWFKEQGIGLVFIADSIDTTTPQGRLFFHITGAFSEYEREIIIERTRAGMQRAKAEGVKMGQPRKSIDIEETKRLIASGVPISRIAKKYGVSRHTVYRRLTEAEKEHSGG